SVLLLQGKAEKLLDSRPQGRFEVLAGIVDLGRYERLHEKADEQRKSLKGAAENLRDRLAAIPEVSPPELIEAEAGMETAEAGRQKAQEEMERLREWEYQSRQWVDLQARLGDVRKRLDDAQKLVGDAPAIERAVERLRELRELLPKLQTVLEQRNAI